MKMKKGYLYVVILAALFIIGGWWFFVSYGEKNRPTVAAGPEAGFLGRKTTAGFSFFDGGQGLRRTEITITQDNIPRVLSAIDYPEKKTAGNKVSVIIDATALKLHDGPAVITASAIDRSLWKNRTETVVPTTIDLLPPQIALYPSQNHINIGGACVVAWNLSEPVSKTGVKVGGIFYPAYKTVMSGKEVYVSYFALPDEKPQGGGEWNISALAVDRAGNETLNTIPALIKKKKFHSDKLVMTDSFLNRKMPEFQAALPELRGKTALETFKIVNSTLRTENLKTIQTICIKTEGKQLWHDTFLRMKNSAPRAFFGDRRTYFYNGQQISDSIHNGVDLASLANAPIEASNSGIVLFTGMIGIYGNSVIIDHGMGLSSIYSHLSSISAKTGQEVKRGEVIGVSGATGLAGGDHLHFGIAINGQFVDPVEWWDPHWIADNITKKLAL
jgi:murein DD-endopeptidase MepM/ murein hydrolase activator NlpD